jgi:hypothetical protein
VTQNELANHLKHCEQALLDPAVRRDRARVSALLAGDFREIGASGALWARDTILSLLATEQYHPPAMEDFACNLIADGVALVRYRTVRADQDSGECSVTQRSSIWIEQAGQWRLRFHQGTKVAQPE